MYTGVIQNGRKPAKGIDPVKAAGQRRDLRWLLGKRGKPPGVSLSGAASGRPAVHQAALSKAAILTIAALILCWVASVARWVGNYVYITHYMGNTWYEDRKSVV